MEHDTNRDRRRFLSMAAVTLAAARLGATCAEGRQSAGVKTLGALKQIDAGVLNVGYAEVGSPGGPAVVLLHGWPYDIYSFVDVAPLLAAKGYRVLVPYLRGYGATRFLSADTVRNGQQAALASDCVAFMDALGIQSAILAGSIGARAPRTSWPRCGQPDVGHWSRSVGI
jgi:hypothetical protein